MNRNELRLGNYIYFHHDGLEIQELEKGEDLDTSMHLFEPIPISKKILQDFGYKYMAGTREREGEGEIYFKGNDVIDKWECWICVGSYCDEGKPLPHIQYLHRLQNLYHSIYNKELK